MSFRKVVYALLIVGLGLSLASPTRAAAPAPAVAAEQVRGALFAAQRDLMNEAGLSHVSLANAESIFSGVLHELIQAANPAAAERATSGFVSMGEAVQGGDAIEFASARAQTWTAILAGSYSIVERSLIEGDLGTAQAWLLVREFRSATRFSRPNADATRALQGLISGDLKQTAAIQFARADLLDSYQARMNEALGELEIANANGFLVRQAELASLAEGYFHILAPAYTEQRGAAALIYAKQAFASLQNSTNVTRALSKVHSHLENFRAAPLSPEDQARRAGQLVRYVNLLAIEYGRGVSNGRVTLQFEIQEAATFHEAALAAFEDLKTPLRDLDQGVVSQSASLLDSLGERIRSANSGGAVAPAAEMRKQADQLLELLNSVVPSEWTQNTSTADFDVIASLLDQMENGVRSNDYAVAESARVEAYAIMESGPEAKLVSMAPELKLSVEALFWNGVSRSAGLGYLIAQEASLIEIRAARLALDAELAEVQKLLSVQSAPPALIGNAAAIVFREGLEAVLILASLMGSLKLDANLKYRRPLWFGTGLALLATLLTWFLARGVLVSLARYGEKLEAVVSLIAIAILLLITNWFFHKTYWEDWLARFHARKKNLIAGEAGLWLGLVSLGFTSVYREGFETVLFLQALVLDGGSALVLTGVAIGLVITLAIGVVAFRMQSRLPYKKMLVATGIVICVVLLVMVGKAVHVLQLVGWMPATLIPNVSLPYWSGMWFGLYASWEGIAAQLLAAVLVIGSYLLAEGLKKRQRSSAHMLHRTA